MKSPDGFLILLCPLVSCLREGSRNFRNWKFMHSSLGPDTCCLTSRPWNLPQWTREFFDWRHSVTHVTARIGGLPHADIVRVKLRLGLKEKKKATWQCCDPLICNYQPSPWGGIWSGLWFNWFKSASYGILPLFHATKKKTLDNSVSSKATVGRFHRH